MNKTAAGKIYGRICERPKRKTAQSEKPIRNVRRFKFGNPRKDNRKNKRRQRRLQNRPKHAEKCLFITHFQIAPDQ